jgi:endoglucanase
MKQYISAIALSLMMLIIVSCKGKTSLEGEWYGLRDKSLLTLALNVDSTFNLKSEASSNYSFSGKYVIDNSNNPATIDLTECSNGMVGAGILRMNSDNSLEMNINFGAPDMVERATYINPQPEAMTNAYFKLTKDKENIMAEIAPKIEISAESKLAFERNKRLGAGINLNAVVDGNLHPGYQRDAPLTDKEIKSIAEVGFQSVRLNVCWSKHASGKMPYTIDEAFFKKVDHIVDECLKNDLAVSIDMHYYPYINMVEGVDSLTMDENYERLDYLWRQIAEHYKDYPNNMVFFDLLNEPNMQMGADKWNEVFVELIKTVRKSNPERTIIIGTPNLGQHWTLNYLQLPDDDWNLIVQFHYYLPHLFTHQGLTYAQAEGSTYTEWKGTPEEKAPIESDLDFCQRWSASHGRPLNMGEYGCMNTADQDSRIRYIGFMREQSEKRGFSSHLWGYREPFMIRDEKTGEWIMPIVEAMKLKTHLSAC